MSDTVHTPSGKISFLWYRLAKQACIVFTYISLGLFLEIYGPTLPDLRATLGLNYGQAAQALSMKPAGAIVGSLLGGYLHEKFYEKTDLLMTLGLLLGAAGMLGSPWMKTLYGLSINILLTGLGEGLINAGGNTMTMHLWGRHATGPMCASHAGFGIGAFLTPLIARPYLSADRQSSSNTSHEYSSDVNVSTPGPIVEDDGGSAQLVYPFTIIAVITIVCSVAMSLFYFCGHPRGFPRREPPSRDLKGLFSPTSCSDGRLFYSTSLLIFLYLFFIQACGGERVYSRFIFSYAVEEADFTKTEAALLNSIFWGCHLSARLSGTFISKLVRLEIFLLLDLLVAFVAAIFLVIYGYDYDMALWVLTGFIGYTCALLFPLGMSWGNLYLKMNSMSTMVLLLGCASGGFIYQYIPGYLFDRFGIRTLFYVMIVWSILALAIFGLMQALSRIGRRGTDGEEAEDSKTVKLSMLNGELSD